MSGQKWYKMRNKIPKLISKMGQMVWLGIALTALFMIVDLLADITIFYRGTSVIQHIFSTEPVELWMRILTISLLIIFSGYGQGAVNRRRRVEELLRESEERYRLLYKKMSDLAVTDGLTGLFNHRYFQEQLDTEIARALRFNQECSLIMLDLDHFKVCNDLFGHPAGDEGLKWVSAVLKRETRQIDTVCRYGGEEFAIIMPQTGLSGAYEVAERLRKGVEESHIKISGDVGIALTISLGVASCPLEGLLREELIHHADLALSEAKLRGRNQTCLAPAAGNTAVAGTDGVVEGQDQTNLNTIYALAASVDSRDRYTYGHSQRVSRYALAIGEAIQLLPERMKLLRAAALLHDVGKSNLPDSIAKKAGPLSAKEWQAMKRHAELGAGMVSQAIGEGDCTAAILHHHEWYDGKGYPAGLRGEGIPIEARVISIADAFDTMTTQRSYAKVMSFQKAAEELLRCAGRQFDPHLVEVFTRAYDISVVPAVHARSGV